MNRSSLEDFSNDEFDHSWFFIAIAAGITLYLNSFLVSISPEIFCNSKSRTISLTILMPNFNKGPYLERAIVSVLQQTSLEFELVISDDRSDDLPMILLHSLLYSHGWIRFWVNQKRLGANQNRAKCVCAAHGIWLLSLDSDDELQNRTVEIVVETHKRTGADMIEFKSFQIDSLGRFRVFEWAPIPFTSADNNTLVSSFWKGRINWTLWRKAVARSLYEQALVMMGPEICMAIINFGEDRLHCATMYRFVHKFVRITYYGYVYYLNVYNSSMRRTPNLRLMSQLVNRFLCMIFAKQLPELPNLHALRVLCDTIQ
jgi:glycosyltransferase involved in cell wall biosynthesis